MIGDRARSGPAGTGDREDRGRGRRPGRTWAGTGRDRSGPDQDRGPGKTEEDRGGPVQGGGPPRCAPEQRGEGRGEKKRAPESIHARGRTCEPPMHPREGGEEKKRAPTASHAANDSNPKNPQAANRRGRDVAETIA